MKRDTHSCTTFGARHHKGLPPAALRWAYWIIAFAGWYATVYALWIKYDSYSPENILRGGLCAQDAGEEVRDEAVRSSGKTTKGRLAKETLAIRPLPELRSPPEEPLWTESLACDYESQHMKPHSTVSDWQTVNTQLQRSYAIGLIHSSKNHIVYVYELPTFIRLRLITFLAALKGTAIVERPPSECQRSYWLLVGRMACRLTAFTK